MVICIMQYYRNIYDSYRYIIKIWLNSHIYSINIDYILKDSQIIISFNGYVHGP